ncbi:MAG: DUF3466 family protein [Aestuariibacter sp.]|jgi:hypothetical protein|nr:hypothetical protein [Alteromonadaceae bacterium]MCP4234369.1 DUF3466 family protein [Aestuariibacter sp.]|tara:strand:+ start:763 stop:2466 length:1704 start_codon:yes stop_codon:yes gene_type:complete
MKLKQLTSAVILATTGMSATAATYTLTPAPVQDLSFYNFSQSIDNTGAMVVMTQTEYNPPIDLDLLDFTNENFTAIFDDPDAVEQGVFSNLDYQRMYSYLTEQRRNSAFIQVFANYRSYNADTVRADLLPGFDVIHESFNDYSRSAYTIARDSVGGDYFVGTANGAFFEVDYTTDDGDDLTYIVNDMPLQPFVQVNGESKVLTPSESEPLGGYGEAFAVNSQLQVAGYSSASFTDTYITSAENCEDDEVRGEVPIELCQYNLIASENTLISSGYRRATIWDMDTQGEVVNTTTYGLVFEPDEDANLLSYYSKAFDINDNGIAVGESSTGETVIYTLPGSSAGRYSGIVATAFIDGEVVELLPRDENLRSTAIAINNDDWVVGNVMRENNGVAREQMFIYNVESGEALYPDGFFATAAVNPRAINNNGIIVGEGEYESNVQTDRQVRAFMYDINVGEFIDLNTLLTCEQQAKYTLVTANDINDNNEIVANAVFKSPQVYITGEEVLDDSGDTNDITRIIAVKLTPTGAQDVEQCDSDEDDKYERKAASLPLYGLIALAVFAVFRRRIR